MKRDQKLIYLVVSSAYRCWTTIDLLTTSNVDALKYSIRECILQIRILLRSEKIQSIVVVAYAEEERHKSSAASREWTLQHYIYIYIYIHIHI